MKQSVWQAVAPWWGGGISKLSLQRQLMQAAFYNPFLLQTAAYNSLLGGAGNRTRNKIS